MGGLWRPTRRVSTRADSSPGGRGTDGAFRMGSSHGIGFDGGPHHGARGTGGRAFDPVRRYDTVDHVGQNRHPRPPFNADRHRDRLDPGAIDLPLQRSIDAIETWRAAKARNREPPGARHLAKGSGGGCESQRGGFHVRHDADDL